MAEPVYVLGSGPDYVDRGPIFDAMWECSSALEELDPTAEVYVVRVVNGRGEVIAVGARPTTASLSRLVTALSNKLSVQLTGTTSPLDG